MFWAFFSLLRNGSERKSELFPFRETDRILTEWLKNFRLFHVPRNNFFFSENDNSRHRRCGGGGVRMSKRKLTGWEGRKDERGCRKKGKQSREAWKEWVVGNERRSQFTEGREGWKGNNSEFKKWRAGNGRKAMKNGRMEGREDRWNGVKNGR